MRFTKGKPRELEGKVLVYASLCRNDESDAIRALYITHDLDDLKVHSGGMSLTELLDNIPKKWYVQKSDDPKDVLPLYGTIAQMSPHEQDLLKCDMLFVGTFNTSGACQHAVQLGAEYYVVLLEDQLRHRKAPVQQSAVPPAPAKPQYATIKHEEFGGYILREYVAPLMHELQSGTEQRFNALKDSFRSFSAETKFYVDVEGFCDALTFGRKHNVPLVDAFYQKIMAVHHEDFALAAQLRDKIALLKQEPAK